MLPASSMILRSLETSARQPAFARPLEKAREPLPVAQTGVRQRVGQEKRPFALPQIAIDFLAVALQTSVQVQNVVCDLERQSNQKAEGVEPAEIRILAVGHKRADPHGVDETVPGRLLQDEPEIVVRPER